MRTSVITSYSIHYTKLYDEGLDQLAGQIGDGLLQKLGVPQASQLHQRIAPPFSPAPVIGRFVGRDQTAFLQKIASYNFV